MYGVLVRVMHQTYVNGLSLVGNRLLDLRLTPLLRKQVSRSDGKHLVKAWNEATCVWERECEGDARCRGRGGRESSGGLCRTSEGKIEVCDAQRHHQQRSFHHIRGM